MLMSVKFWSSEGKSIVILTLWLDWLLLVWIGAVQCESIHVDVYKILSLDWALCDTKNNLCDSLTERQETIPSPPVWLPGVHWEPDTPHHTSHWRLDPAVHCTLSTVQCQAPLHTILYTALAVLQARHDLVLYKQLYIIYISVSSCGHPVEWK